MSIWSYIGLFFVVIVSVRFFKEVGKSFPVIEFMLVIAGYQWIVGPIISYNLAIQHYKFYMRVDEFIYMSYIVPTYIVFGTLLLFGIKRYRISLNFENLNSFIKYAKYIFLIGLVFDVLKSFVPGGLLFFVYLLSLLKYVGVGLLLFSGNKINRLFFYGTIIYLFLNSLSSGMFHDLILWSVFLFLIWALKYKPTNKIKLLIVFFGLFFVIAIQSVKSTFRDYIWESSNNINKFELFFQILNENLSNDLLFDDYSISQLNVRLNQGWHISSVMSNVPSFEPFANGKTIINGIYSSFLPRFLIPDKKIAGGRENFLKYTGEQLGESTSMGISLIGEGYANFGELGGAVFMFIWGVFLLLYWRKLFKLNSNHPIIVFFIPLLFLQVVKAETEFLVVFNHIVKASFTVWLFFIICRRFLNLKI